MTTITEFPAIRPSLLLDFANSGRVDPRISSTRASTATCYGPDGVLRTVASNVPRIDFDPLTGKCLGLLVEEARTNLLLNSVFAGAASGSPGTAPTNFPFSVGNGSTEVIPGGLYTTLRLSTATAARHFLTQLNTPVEVGQYAFSLPCNFYVASSVGNFLGASAGTAVFTARYFVDGVEIASGTSVGTGKKIVSMLLDVTTAGTISMRFGVGVAVSAVGDVEFSLPRLEKGAFPTSPILTNTAAATRAAEASTLPGFTWSNWTGGLSFLIEADTPSAWPADATLLALSNGAAQDNQIDIRYVATGVATRTRAGGTTISSTIHTGVPLSARGRVALSISATNFISAANGAAAYSVAAPFSPAALLDRLAIGFRAANSNPFSGHIQRISIYPTALTAAQIQRLSA